MEYPALMDDPVTSAAFAPDVIARAKAYLAHEPRGTGTLPARDVARSLARWLTHGVTLPAGPYAHSQGMAAVRKEIANFINARDSSSDADPNLIFLTNGASAGVDLLMRAMPARWHHGADSAIPAVLGHHSAPRWLVDQVLLERAKQLGLVGRSSLLSLARANHHPSRERNE